MSMTIHLGWWLLPAIITVAAFGAAWLIESRDRKLAPRGGDYNFSGLWSGLFAGILYGAAAIVSLIAWLVWASFGGAA